MIQIEDSLFGSAYYETIKRGPHVRVTTIAEFHTEFGLLNWMKNSTKEEIEKVGEETRNKGSVLHQYFCGHLKGESINVLEEWAKKPVDNFQKWCLANKLKSTHVERSIISEQFGLGGTIDCEGELNGEPVIIDWKTGELYESHEMQIAAYGVLLDSDAELVLVKVHRYGGEIKTKVIDDWRTPFQAFTHLYEFWKLKNKKKLLWACAPKEVLEARSKTRGEKRLAFEEVNHREEYVWPWLYKNSTEVLDV